MYGQSICYPRTTGQPYKVLYWPPNQVKVVKLRSNKRSDSVRAVLAVTKILGHGSSDLNKKMLQYVFVVRYGIVKKQNNTKLYQECSYLNKI